MAEEFAFSCTSSIRGFHVYQEVWTPFVNETLFCQMQVENSLDRYAVAVVRAGEVVGHVPKKISRLCSLFIGQGGTITATVTGPRQYSSDLPQGGLQIPCSLLFNGPERQARKCQQLVSKLKLDVFTPPSASEECDKEEEGKTCTDSEPKKSDRDPTVLKDSNRKRAAIQDYSTARTRPRNLTSIDKQQIVGGERLTDNHLNFVQYLLKQQFPSLSGLQNTHYLSKSESQGVLKDDNGLQVIFCRGDHWIVASTLHLPPTEVAVYDSLYNYCDEETKELLRHVMGCPDPTVKMGALKHQLGSDDCGVFAAAVATSLAFGLPAPYHFEQQSMRQHLLSCLEKGELTPHACMPE